MSPGVTVVEAGKGSQADRLAQAFRDNPGISRRDVARQMRGLRATKEQIDSKKSEIVKWLGGRHGIGDKNAELIAAAFNALAGRVVYEPDFFKNPDLPRTYAEAIRENTELRAEIRRLREAG